MKEEPVNLANVTSVGICADLFFIFFIYIYKTFA